MQRLKSGGIAWGSCFGNTPVPLKLATVPYGDASGLVLDVKEVHIRGIDAPYNATLFLLCMDTIFFFDMTLTTAKRDMLRFFLILALCISIQSLIRTIGN